MQPAPALQSVLQVIQHRWGDTAIVPAEAITMPRAGMVAARRSNAALSAPLAPLAPYLRPGQVVEIRGAPGSGKTSVALALLAALVSPHKPATYVDSPQTFYPPSAAASGVGLERLWIVRLPTWSATLAAVEALLSSGVLGVVLWDLVQQQEVLSGAQLRRLRLAAARSHTTLLLLTTVPRRPMLQALDSGAHVRLLVQRRQYLWEQLGSQRLLAGLEVNVELMRAPGKPATQPFSLTLRSAEQPSLANPWPLLPAPAKPARERRS